MAIASYPAHSDRDVVLLDSVVAMLPPSCSSATVLHIETIHMSAIGKLDER